MQLHHRGSSIPSIKAHPSKVDCNAGYTDYYYSSVPNPNLHVGALVGGPNSSDQFSDVRSDYSHSEPTTYMNAAFVGSLAAAITDARSEAAMSLQLLNINTINTKATTSTNLAD